MHIFLFQKKLSISAERKIKPSRIREEHQSILCHPPERSTHLHFLRETTTTTVLRSNSCKVDRRQLNLAENRKKNRNQIPQKTNKNKLNQHKKSFDIIFIVRVVTTVLTGDDGDKCSNGKGSLAALSLFILIKSCIFDKRTSREKKRMSTTLLKSPIKRFKK